jgi:subtilisin family serine protease
MRSLIKRFGWGGSLAVPAAVAAIALVVVSSDAQAQFRANSFSVGPRGGSFGGSNMRGIEPRFQRFYLDGRDDAVLSGRGKGKSTSAGSTGDGHRRPGRRPPHRRPPVIVGPGVGVAIGTVGPAGPAGAGPSSPAASPSPRNNNAINIPSPNERRFVKDEVVLEFAGNVAPSRIAQLLARHRLVQLESQTFTLTGSTLVRARIANRRSVRAVLQRLAREATLRAGQPNYLYQGSQQKSEASPSVGDPAQYALAKLHLNEAHGLATGDKVLVAVIDSSIDLGHPELKGVIAGSYDALGKCGKPHLHGTAIAGAIAAHARLMGAAPSARILAICAFSPAGAGVEATTFAILKGIEYAVVHKARVINMSFAGPADPGLARQLAAATRRGVVLIAAAGNFGPKSPPQYPAADPDVIAVSATDANDKMFSASNIGPHIAVTAPGVDILLPAPGDNYQMTSGTSFSAAYVAGIAALVIQRAPALTPAAVRNVLVSTAKDLGPRGKDPEFGAGLVDAYQAILSAPSETAGSAQGEPQPSIAAQ